MSLSQGVALGFHVTALRANMSAFVLHPLASIPVTRYIMSTVG